MPVVTTDVQEYQKNNKRCVSTVITNRLKIAVGSDPETLFISNIQCGSNMTGTDLYVNKPHCAAAVRP